MSMKIGEVTAEVTGDVKKTEDVKLTLRVSFTDRVKEMSFKPLDDLKKGDKVKITVEKV